MRARFAPLFGSALFSLVVLGGCGGAPPAGPPRAASSPDALTINIALPIEELDLPNGLHVVLHQERSHPTTLVHVRYNVGSKDDPRDRSGFAHLYEHLMFRGSKNTGTKDYQQWLEDVGGDIQGGTNFDHTDYYEYVPPSAVGRAIWLEADRMAYPLASLDDGAFANERDVVKNEWRQHYEDVALGNLKAIAHEAIYGPLHPYGRPTIGRGEDLDRITLAEAREFARTYYRPNNATLIVAGLFDATTTKALIQRYFATIPAGPAPAARTLPAPKLARAERIDVVAAVDGPAVMLAWPAPAASADGGEELELGLDLFANLVQRRLVTEKKIANAVQVRYERASLGGVASVLVQLKPGASADTAISVLDEYLATVSKVGRNRRFTWDNIGSFKTQELVSVVGSMESLEGRAQRILQDIERHGAPNTMKLDLGKIQDVASADVGAAVERFLIDAPRVTVVVRPDPSAPRAGKKVAR